MARFPKFFRSKSNSATPVPAPTEAPETSTAQATVPLVAADTFIELIEPAEAPEAKPAARPLSALKQLAGRDLFDEGFTTGYKVHDPDVGRMAIERIKAEITHVTEGEIGHIGQLIANLNIEVEALGDEPRYGVSLRRLRAQIHALQADRLRLEGQLLLVAGNSGPAEKPVASYQAGFEQGCKKYLLEVALCNQYNR